MTTSRSRLSRFIRNSQTTKLIQTSILEKGERMRRQKKVVTKLVMILLVLLFALLFTGMTYGIWSDKLYVSGTLQTGTWDIVLGSSGNVPYEGLHLVSSSTSFGLSLVSSNITQNPTYVSSNISGNMISIGIINAQPGVDYQSSFDIWNTGTVPVKIQIIDILGLPSEISAEVSGIDAIVDPGQRQGAAVRAQLTNRSGTGKNFNFTVLVQAVVWNQP
jgi:hypothetical protein